MLIAVSPYHLTSREPPAMAALLLAERVVTLIPSPRAGTGRGALHRAVERSPHYLRFMQSWEWSLPLWRAGVVHSTLDSVDPTDDLFEAFARIDADPALADLRPLMRSELFGDDDRALDELSRDILRAGPDPSFSVPLTLALDRFAARVGAVVARPEPVSLAQRAEARLASPLFAVAVPVLLQAGGEHILRARTALAGPLNDLRRAAALSARIRPDAEPGERAVVRSASPTTALGAPLRAAASRYTEAFEAFCPALASGRDDVRTVTGTVALEAFVLPDGAVLRASLAAARALHGRAARLSAVSDAGMEAADDPGPPVATMFVRVLGAAPRGGR